MIVAKLCSAQEKNITWDFADSCDLAHAANSTLRSKQAHVRFLLDWGGAQIGNKIEGNMENSNSAIQFSVFVFGIVRRIRRSRGRHLEHLRATLRARALVFQPSAGIEYSKLLFPILLHGIATLIFNLWSSYRSIDKKRCVTKRWQFRENSSHTQDMFILQCSSTMTRHATRGRSYFHRRRSNAGACLTAEDITHVPSKKTAVVIFQLIRRSSRFRRSLLMKLREFSKFDVYQRNMKCNLSP